MVDCLKKSCIPIDRKINHIYIWGSYVAVDLNGWFHLFYKPSFVGYIKYFPYRTAGVITIIIGSLMAFIGWAMGESSRSTAGLKWLAPIASILLVFGVFLLIAGLVFMLISRRSLVIESHGGLCLEYFNAPMMSKNHFKTLTEKLEERQELI